jgi:hypothetical protein
MVVVVSHHLTIPHHFFLGGGAELEELHENDVTVINI